MDLGLDGKVALVSGASAGMGRAIARELAAEGVSVVLTARRKAPLEEAAEEIRSTGARVGWILADMSIRDDVARAVAETTEMFGAPDIAIANVAPTNTFGFDDTSDEDFLRVYQELVMSMVYLSRLVLPAMVARNWGRLVNIGSVCMKEPHRYYPLISSNTGRAGVVGLNRTLANEYAAHGVTVNTIAPGQIDTGRAGSVGAVASGNGIAQVEPPPAIMMGRLGTPSEIAGICVFLCSARASYITGQTIAVDGGWTRGLL